MTPNFRSISNVTSGNLKEIYEIIGSKSVSGVFDGASRPASHTADEVEKIQSLLHNEVRLGMTKDGGFKTLNQVQDEAKRFVNDSFYNLVNGIGTPADPGYYNSANIPISLTPNEATSFYASGGLPRTIIDKKVKGIFLNGHSFKGQGWEQSEIEELQKYSEKTNFAKALKDGIRDGLIYGGSGVIPAFKRDSMVSYQYDAKQLRRFIKKDSIDYFWTADRWNLVMVPNYNISAKDYLHPEYLYCPLAGQNVNTARMALIRPNELPYWGTLRQIGWGQSEFEGWIRSVLAYNVMMASIPIMSQQMSLLYHHIPLDGIMVQNGVDDGMKSIADQNAKSLRDWSMMNPKVINSLGEIKTVERNYAGYPELAMLLRQDISAKCRISESSIWYTQPQGFDNNTGDITIRDAETMQLLGNEMAPQIHPLVKMLVYSCFGPESPQADKVDGLQICFDSPTVMTSEEKAKLGNSFASIIQTLTSSGAPLDSAAKIAQEFMTSVDVSDAMMEEFAAAQQKIEEQEAAQMELETAQIEQKTSQNGEKGGSKNQNGANSAKKGRSENGENTTRMSPSTKAQPGSENFMRRLGKKLTGKGQSGG